MPPPNLAISSQMMMKLGKHILYMAKNLYKFTKLMSLLGNHI